MQSQAEVGFIRRRSENAARNRELGGGNDVVTGALEKHRILSQQHLLLNLSGPHSVAFVNLKAFLTHPYSLADQTVSFVSGYGVPGLTVTSGPFSVMPRTFVSRRTHSAQQQARTSVCVPSLLTSFHKHQSGGLPKELTTASTWSLGTVVATTKQKSPVVHLSSCTRSLSILVHFCPQILVVLVR